MLNYIGPGTIPYGTPYSTFFFFNFTDTSYERSSL